MPRGDDSPLGVEGGRRVFNLRAATLSYCFYIVRKGWERGASLPMVCGARAPRALFRVRGRKCRRGTPAPYAHHVMEERTQV